MNWLVFNRGPKLTLFMWDGSGSEERMVRSKDARAAGSAIFGCITDTVVRVHGMPWCAKYQYRTHTCGTCDPITVGIPVPVPNPIHKDPLAQNPKHLGSPNWYTPSPNRPITFWCPSLPPQLSSTLPISPLCPNIPLMPPKNHTKSQLTFELVSLIKTTSEAFQNIVCISKRLIWQVNAECQLAHKSWRTLWSLHEDAHGNTVCSQPPVFPSGRGVPATGLSEGSELRTL
jgi:hypothetical protein